MLNIKNQIREELSQMRSLFSNAYKDKDLEFSLNLTIESEGNAIGDVVEIKLNYNNKEYIFKTTSSSFDLFNHLKNSIDSILEIKNITKENIIEINKELSLHENIRLSIVNIKTIRRFYLC